MMKSVESLREDEEDDEEEFLMKKDGSSHKGDLNAKVDGKGNDQKSNTPKSKHSATEQRRRCKINERFQFLRDIIPHNDQKRDKASFLLEVIEYIQFLQEKVQKFEASYQGLNQEPPTKLMPWRNSHWHGESMIDRSRAIKNNPNPGLVFAGKFDDCSIDIVPTNVANVQNPGESDLSAGAAYKAMDHQSALSNAEPLPIPLQTNTLAPISRDDGLAQPPQRPISETDNVSSHIQSQLWQNRECTTDRPITSDAVNEQEELTIEKGTISISTVYSQGLLNSLTQALQSSGVDLSHASISVQIDFGKRATSELTSMTFSAKDQEGPCSSNRAMENSRVASSGEDSDQGRKRLRTEKS